MNPGYFLGVDVGTGSARAGIFGRDGRMVGAASQPIEMWKPVPDHVEQSSDDIWRACGRAVRTALKTARLKPSAIRGIGFDATCSLVALDEDDRPVSVSITERAGQNVIVWMDHRAIPQAQQINRTRASVLRYVGGVISPEMQTPKLLWLKEHLPGCWRHTARFLDLPDYLTYRATGDDTRSLCTTVCKWTYLSHRGFDGAGWDASYFRRIGLGDLAAGGFTRLGTRVRPMGEPVGRGLTPRAARALGLAAGTRHIIEAMNREGYAIDTLLACGGGTKNPVFLREHADITGCRIVLPREPEAVLLGSAVLGAVAAGAFPTVLTAMNALNAAGRTIISSRGRVSRYHAAKYRVFHRLHDDFVAYREIMNTY